MSIRITDKSDKTYIVLGAPGSATSFMSKVLERSGVEMGNTKGERWRFYENQEFEKANKKIIREAGGSVVNPPSEEDILAVDADGLIKGLIKKFKRKYWGWKDPLNSLTIKKYLPHLEGDVYLICMFRRPKNIVNKYKWFRKRRTDEENKSLIVEYNKSIISAIKEFCRL